jgi:DNA invertase Pin-like site-specific DNA recombinase
VSTTHQTERRQEISLESYKIDRRFIDKLSGKNTERPELQRILETVQEGDTVIVESISRFARNTKDLLELVDKLEQKKVEFISRKENIDTSTPSGKFMLTVFAAMAQMEREIIVERIREGIYVAGRDGTKSGNPIGRPPAPCPKDFDKYYTQWQEGLINKKEFAKLLGIARSTLYDHMGKYEEKRKAG